MERIVIASYRPKTGKEKDLHRLIKTHVENLRNEGLASARSPIVLKAEDGTVVEIFGWKSKEAIEAAHSHPVVLKMWQEFEAVCNYVPPTSIKEFSGMFPEFELLQ